jgi:hypothetical protein
MSPEDVAKRFGEITDFERKNDYPVSGADTFARIIEEREKAKL